MINMGNLSFCKFISSSYLYVIFVLFFACFCHAANNTLAQGNILRDGQTLKSDGGTFELGFFSPPNSSSRYVGIWYSNISVQSVVWVANRNSPISSRNGHLTLGNDGKLLVLDDTGRTFWSSNSTLSSSSYTATLHDDGNFEIRGASAFPGPSESVWQSFDHPTDTYLPGMKVLVNQKLGETRLFISWKSNDDPSVGNFTLGVDPRASPQMVIWEGSNRRWRSGYWNGLYFTGVPSAASPYYYGFKLSSMDSQGNMYFTYTPSNTSNTFKFRVTWDGYEKSFLWVDGGKEWGVVQQEPGNDCEIYNKCGANGYCKITNGNPTCECYVGFAPKNLHQWNKGDSSAGCIRKTLLHCERNNSLISKDSFLKVNGVTLPDFAELLGTVQDQCESLCLKDCSCSAYAYVSTIGCMGWTGDLVDVQRFSEEGDTLYVRVVESSELGSKSKLSAPKIAAISLVGAILLCILLFSLWRFRAIKVVQAEKATHDGLTARLRKIREYSTDTSGSVDFTGDGNLVDASDLPLFNYDLVSSATNFFSEENKLGQGGFGPVYKGILHGGEEIAVKKLSRKSGQGLEEFKNEIVLIAKLQHRNLVRILGFCVHGEEKMLVYEYMPNKSLDVFLFDPEKQGELPWRKRFTIIEGIARGLLYLHRDARCKIIHRDLKASNILLDQEMNPKISDFGMARIFGGNQDQANTNRVVGTYGYMSPEYAMEGFFSDKSDVYSFGVLLLEVVTGRRNTSVRSTEHMNLVEYAWQLYSEGKAADLVDPSIESTCPSNEVSKCIQIAMLCVQDSAVYRPIMSQVVFWLESDNAALPIPREPTLTYSSFRGFIDIDCQRGNQNDASTNNLTISRIIGR